MTTRGTLFLPADRWYTTALPDPVPERPSRINPLRLGLDVIVRSYGLWLATKARFTPTERQRLFGLTIAIGGVCGLVAVGFHEGIHWIESLSIDRAFDADEGWFAWVVAVPMLGALACGVALVYLPGARGSGIPQVKVAYAVNVGRLRVRDSLGKFVLGIIQLGTGSSLGREGPTVQICAGVAKAIGRLGGVSLGNLKLLLPVGTAAGIAAAFNAPIAAVTFTIEEVVGKLDQTLLSGVIVAAALAAVVERSVLGENPVFTIPKDYGLDHASSLVLYAALGLAAALMSIAFTESLLWLRARFARSRLPVWLRPAIGGLSTGSLAAIVMLVFGVGGVTGGGYVGLQSALTGNLDVQVLLVLGVVKLAATVLSYASGGAGGIFAPSLFMGAMLGGAFGVLDVDLFGHAHSEVGAFALVGMGAVFAGTVRAPITSVLIIIEMTAGYGLTLPLMISNMMAYGLATRLRPIPIYEALLKQDGIDLHTKKPPSDPLERLVISQLPLEPVETVFQADARIPELLRSAESGRQEVFPVVDRQRRIIGILTLEDLASFAADHDLDGLIRAIDLMRPPVVVRREESLARALELMVNANVPELPVIDAQDQILGSIDERAIAHEYLKLRSRRQLDPSASGEIVLPTRE